MMQGRVLEQRRAELARETREAEQRKQLLAQQEEEFMQSLSRKAKGEEDLSLLKKKLTKLRAKYKETKAEIEDQQATQNKEREDLMEELRNLSKHLQFQDLLLAHFVPNEQSEMIAARAIWDEGRDNYVMQPFNFKQSNLQEKRPPSTHANSARPVSTFEQYHRYVCQLVSPPPLGPTPRRCECSIAWMNFFLHCLLRTHFIFCALLPPSFPFFDCLYC